MGVKKMISLLKTVEKLITLLILTLSLLLVLFLFSSKHNKDGIPSLGNYRFFIVASESMKPALRAGDVIIVEPLDITLVNKSDIITFRDHRDPGKIVTHRVMEINKGKGLEITTKGDANTNSDSGSVTAKDIIGRLILRIPYFGKLLDFTFSKSGLIWLVLVPAAIALICETRKVALILSDQDRKNFRKGQW